MAGHLGRRLRKQATTTAVAAAAVAALSASQGPGVAPVGGESLTTDGTPPASSGDSATGNSPYYTELPPLNSPVPDRPGAGIVDAHGTTPAGGATAAGIPATVFSAYQQAEQHLRSVDPGCNLSWQLLAGIGKVESGHARGGRVDSGGTTTSPILGPVLNGVGFANISDTDGGAHDGDTRYDRAVGPMQFIPSTWASWGQDANDDGRKDPNNIFDAARAAGMYLCAGNRNLALQADLDRAVLSYNQSREYLRTVLSWFDYYKRDGAHRIPDGTGHVPTERSDRPSGNAGGTRPGMGRTTGNGSGNSTGTTTGKGSGTGSGSGGKGGSTPSATPGTPDAKPSPAKPVPPSGWPT
ncbi:MULTISPECIES: lytic transglycosylase domain-containing protein, partial [unclassified Streptomyces]|uniref:lytic transglycosylase domain-containing protein n=1 Tax=unclassified Streptomyces TaxID=2593676 RepID=UPI001D048D57